MIAILINTKRIPVGNYITLREREKKQFLLL